MDARLNRDGPPIPTTPPTAADVAFRRQIGRSITLSIEVAGVIAVALVAILTSWLTTSALAVTAATVLVAAAVFVALFQVHSRRQETWHSYQEECVAELDAWRHRWHTLQQEAHQTTTALSRMRDGVVLLNQDSAILLINPAARFLLDLSANQNLFERPFHEVVRIPELNRAVEAARAGMGPQKVLVEVVSGDSIRPVKARVDQFAAGGDDNVLMTLRDESEAHRVEEMRREFVANISHELKTPLAAIKGYAETVELAIKDDPEAAGYFMTQIQTQCQRLERLIADMMQLARAQSGRANMRITSVSLPQVIADSIKTYAPIAEAKNIDLTFEAAPDEVVVRSDHEATLTIANNLIGNAIHYTPDGGRVQVSCHNENVSAWLVVTDTGVGIDPSEHKRIFERFYRIERSRTSGDGGTGIGLSVVKNLALALGGDVRVISTPGQGATFQVRLPREI